MATNVLELVPKVEIDPQGTFKYVLIKVYAPETPDGNEPCRMIVRGNSRGPYHADIYDETVKKLNQLKLDSECVGGGRIHIDPSQKKIRVYGLSQGFGKADHEISCQILKEFYTDYEITWSDDEK